MEHRELSLESYAASVPFMILSERERMRGGPCQGVVLPAVNAGVFECGRIEIYGCSWHYKNPTLFPKSKLL